MSLAGDPVPLPWRAGLIQGGGTKISSEKNITGWAASRPPFRGEGLLKNRLAENRLAGPSPPGGNLKTGLAANKSFRNLCKRQSRMQADANQIASRRPIKKRQWGGTLISLRQMAATILSSVSPSLTTNTLSSIHPSRWSASQRSLCSVGGLDGCQMLKGGENVLKCRYPPPTARCTKNAGNERKCAAHPPP